MRETGEVVHYTVLHDDEVEYIDGSGQARVGTETHGVVDGDGAPLFFTVDRAAAEDMVRTLNGDRADRYRDYELPGWVILDGGYRLGAIIDLGHPDNSPAS